MGQFLKYAILPHDTCYVVGKLIVPISAIIRQVSIIVRVVIFLFMNTKFMNACSFTIQSKKINA